MAKETGRHNDDRSLENLGIKVGAGCAAGNPIDGRVPFIVLGRAVAVAHWLRITRFLLKLRSVLK